MIFRFIKFLVTVAFLFCTEVSAQENPYVKMSGKPYAEYCHTLERITLVGVWTRDSMWVVENAALMRQASKITKIRKWELEADFFELKYHYHYTVNNVVPYQNSCNKVQVDSLSEIYIHNLQKIVQRARKIDAGDIELRALFQIWDNYRVQFQNYEMSFRLCKEMDNKLSTIQTDDFPQRPNYYKILGDLYYSFHEYEKAKSFYEKGLENVNIDNPATMDIGAIKMLWNNVGLIYRNQYKDLDKSDSCFNQILAIKFYSKEGVNDTDKLRYEQDEYELCAGIAKGNLGTNHYLRGDYEKAIPLLVFAVEKAVAYDEYNYPYAVSKAITLSEIFIETRDLTSARLYVNKTNEYLGLLRQRIGTHGMSSEADLLAKYYKMMSHYCRLIGNNELALVYADSNAAARSQFEENFNRSKLHYVEMQEKQLQLDNEMLRSENYLHNLIMISILTLFFFLLVILLYYSYRKQQEKNRGLYRQIKEQDHLAEELKFFKQQNAVETSLQGNIQQRQLVARFCEYLQENKFYTNIEINIDEIVSALVTNRTDFFKAVKAVTNKTPIEYIHSVRLEEAKQALESNFELSLETIAYDYGFGSYTTFYRLFKERYQISPAKYRNIAKESR